MLPAITTTHAIPRPNVSSHISMRTSIVTCPHCFETLGSASGIAERRSIEARHKCGEKTLAEQPAIAVPFS
jgi:hypothetical protein